MSSTENGHARAYPVALWRRIREVFFSREVQGLNEESLVHLPVRLCALEEEAKHTRARLREIDGALREVGEPEPVLESRGSEWQWLKWLVCVLIGITALGNLLAFQGVIEVLWMRLLLVALLPILAVTAGWIGGPARRMDRRDPDRLFRYGIGVVLLVLAIVATGSAAGLRAYHLVKLEVQQQHAALDNAELVGDQPAPAAPNSVVHLLFALVALALGVGGELATAATVDRLLYLAPIRHVLRLRDDRARLRKRLAQIPAEQEECRRLIRLHELRVELEERRHARETVEVHVPALPPPPPEPQDPIGPFTWKVIMSVLAALVTVALLFVFLTGVAQGAEPVESVTVILLDLSTSSAVGEEHALNVQAVDGLLARVRSPRHRIAILRIGEGSFGAVPLLTSTSPAEAGLYDQHLEAWQQRLRAQWQRRAAELRPSARQSDYLGALARAVLELEEVSAARKRLVILGDGRHVGDGLNLERPIGNPLSLVERLARKGLPRLDGVEVYVLGAHTAGVDERHWGQLRAFWAMYFKRAAAELKAFTPNRRLVER